MAKILFTAFLADARGKVAGTVFSKNRSGAYTRTKVSPVNPASTAQTERRGFLSSLSAGWRELTQEQRDAWDGQVENYGRTNELGNAYKLTGHTLFVGLNANLKGINLPALETPIAPSGVLTIPFVPAAATDEISVFIPTAIPAEFRGVIRATQGVSVGRKFVKNLYRVINVLAPMAGGATPLDITAAYVSQFGTPVEGTRIGLEMYLINVASGQKSTPYATTIEVTAP